MSGLLDLSNLYGLIIGIDNHKFPECYPPPGGCISDAPSIFNYFSTDLKVPQGQIICLLDAKATRKEIVDAFQQHLIDNNKINCSDPIVIYFADVGLRQGSNEADGGHTHGIPGTTTGALIRKLYQVKDGNITIILDCCFSGGITSGYTLGRSWYDPDAPPIPAALDLDLMAALGQSPSSQTKYAAAVERSGSVCQNDEALEVPITDPSRNKADPLCSGLFTTTLLEALRQYDLARTTYTSLTRMIQRQIASVTPQADKTCDITLQPKERQDVFYVKAGSAMGVQLGTELDLYFENAPAKLLPTARLVVTQATPIDAVLALPVSDTMKDLSQNSCVIVPQRTNQSIRILRNNESEIPRCWQAVFDKVESLPSGEPADLVLVSTEKGVLLQRQDPFVMQLEPRNILLEHRLLVEDRTQKLAAIAHFHFRLKRRNPDSPLYDRHGAKSIGIKLIELKRLECDYSWASKEYAPAEKHPKDLSGDSLLTGKVAQLRATPGKRYGLELTNRSSWPLFAWVIYFDLEDYSITFLYDPPHRKANLLNNGGLLSVGYGGNGTDPLLIDKSKYSSKDSGALMLFVSDHWVDISHIAQPSIHEPVMDSESREQEQGGYVKPDTNVWDVVAVGVSISG
ncbi:hypothetical protein FRC07_008906 [Ceratobasidium sp. 392]|nr:hypothetical protein FRC07_008906 [Ceratobasidium sp. 392]